MESRENEVPPLLDIVKSPSSPGKYAYVEIGSSAFESFMEVMNSLGLVNDRSKRTSLAVLLLSNKNWRAVTEWFLSGMSDSCEVDRNNDLITKLKDPKLEISFLRLDDKGLYVLEQCPYDAMLSPKFSVVDRLRPDFSSGLKVFVKFDWIATSESIRSGRERAMARKKRDIGWWAKLFRDPSESSRELLARFLGIRDSDPTTEKHLRENNPFYSEAKSWSGTLLKILVCLMLILLFASLAFDDPRGRIR